MRWRAMSIVLFNLIIFVITPSLYASKRFASTLCKYDGFSCHRVKRGQSWYSLFPDEHDRDIVMRINRMNTELYPGLLIAIPDQLAKATVMDFAPFPRKIQPPGEKMVVVDPIYYAWGAYEPNGVLLRWGPISAGSDYCQDVNAPCHTHSGSYRVFSLGSSECYSTKFPLPHGGAPMPFCMYFNNGQALHGEPKGLPGFNDSHGCVRLYVNDAEWLRYDFIEGPNANNHFQGTKVLVRDY